MKNADFTSSKPPKRPPSAKEVPDGIVSSEISRGRKTEESRKVDLGGLVYNIQIVLPETRDVAVYDALFRSFKEHLL